MTVIEDIEEFKQMMRDLFNEWYEEKTTNTKELNSKESAKYLQIAEGTFYNWASEGKIKPSSHIGGSIPMYLKSDLDALKQKPTLIN